MQIGRLGKWSSPAQNSQQSIWASLLEPRGPFSQASPGPAHRAAPETLSQLTVSEHEPHMKRYTMAELCPLKKNALLPHYFRMEMGSL